MMKYEKISKKKLIEIMEIKDLTIECLEKRIVFLGRAVLKEKRHHAEFLIALANRVSVDKTEGDTLFHPGYDPVAEAENITKTEEN